jgi:hypothetical protein
MFIDIINGKNSYYVELTDIHDLPNDPQNGFELSKLGKDGLTCAISLIDIGKLNKDEKYRHIVLACCTTWIAVHRIVDYLLSGKTMGEAMLLQKQGFGDAAVQFVSDNWSIASL